MMQFLAAHGSHSHADSEACDCTTITV